MTYYHGRREYPTLQKLFKGEIVELGGIRFMKDEGDLKSGDLYIAERNTGPKLLTVKRVDLDYGMVVPMTFEYCYDVGECIKVKEASLSTTSCPSSEEPKKAKLSPPPWDGKEVENMKTWYAVGIGQTGEYGYSEPSSKARVRNLIKRYAVSREKETYGYRFYLSAIPKEALWYANRGVRSPWVMVGR